MTLWGASSRVVLQEHEKAEARKLFQSVLLELGLKPGINPCTSYKIVQEKVGISSTTARFISESGAGIGRATYNKLKKYKGIK